MVRRFYHRLAENFWSKLRRTASNRKIIQLKDFCSDGTRRFTNAWFRHQSMSLVNFRYSDIHRNSLNDSRLFLFAFSFFICIFSAFSIRYFSIQNVILMVVVFLLCYDLWWTTLFNSVLYYYMTWRSIARSTFFVKIWLDLNLQSEYCNLNGYVGRYICQFFN